MKNTAPTADQTRELQRVMKSSRYVVETHRDGQTLHRVGMFATLTEADACMAHWQRNFIPSVRIVSGGIVVQA